MSEPAVPATERKTIPSVLRQFARPRSTTERCELCSTELGHMHAHLLQPAKRRIVCACQACSLLFCGSGEARYVRIPHRILVLGDSAISDLQWESLMIPINLAFFYWDSAADRIRAIYPSPAGATESLLSLESWEEIRTQNPLLQSMEPDVEAFLVNRVGDNAEYFLVPIDTCFHLVGLIRLHWKGLSGGTEVWQHIREFFAGLRARAGYAGRTTGELHA
jgi:Family of unknown function (DUF5947)